MADPRVHDHTALTGERHCLRCAKDRIAALEKDNEALRDLIEDARNTFGLILYGDCGLENGHDDEDDCVRAQAAAFIRRTREADSE